MFSQFFICIIYTPIIYHSIYPSILPKGKLLTGSSKVWLGTDSRKELLTTDGGTITGNLRLKGSGNYGNMLNFGDGDYVHLYENSDDNLEIKAKNINFVVSSKLTHNNATILTSNTDRENINSIGDVVFTPLALDEISPSYWVKTTSLDKLVLSRYPEMMTYVSTHKYNYASATSSTLSERVTVYGSYLFKLMYTVNSTTSITVTLYRSNDHGATWSVYKKYTVTSSVACGNVVVTLHRISSNFLFFSIEKRQTNYGSYYNELYSWNVANTTSSPSLICNFTNSNQVYTYCSDTYNGKIIVTIQISNNHYARAYNINTSTGSASLITSSDITIDCAAPSILSDVASTNYDNAFIHDPTQSSTWYLLYASRYGSTDYSSMDKLTLSGSTLTRTAIQSPRPNSSFKLILFNNVLYIVDDSSKRIYTSTSTSYTSISNTRSIVGVYDGYIIDHEGYAYTSMSNFASGSYNSSYGRSKYGNIFASGYSIYARDNPLYFNVSNMPNFKVVYTKYVVEPALTVPSISGMSGMDTYLKVK